MTLSYRAAIVQSYDGRDQMWPRTFPWPAPIGDGGLGGGGADSITVKMGTDDYRLAWNSSVGSYPPAGYGYPAQPTLTGSEDWWIHGIHGYGRVTWSPNYGVVVSGVVGLRPNGTVGHVNASFWTPRDDANIANRWRYMAPYLNTGGEGGPNSWSYHYGYDLGLRSDLVCRLDSRGLYRITGGWGSTATLGALIWQPTATHLAAGFPENCAQSASGFMRVNLPWRSEWWICKVSDGGGTPGVIWALNHSMSGDASAYQIALDSQAQARITDTFPSNLCLSVDQTGRRVFAAQADVLATPQFTNNLNKYPLLLWEINPITKAWTPISIPVPLYVAPPGKVNGHNLLTWHGGFRWIYWDLWGSLGGNVAYAPVSNGYSEGGYKPRLIFIPKSGAPRQLTITGRAMGTFPSNDWNRQKHAEYAQRGADGRIYQSGGDSPVNGTQRIISFLPEDLANTGVLEQAENFTGKEVRPANPDENGWQYRDADGMFWFMYGYPYPTDMNTAGNMRHGTWATAANMNVSEWATDTGGGQVLWRWNPTTKVWTTFPLTAASGETGPFGNETLDPLQKITSAHQKRWYYDSSADRMVIAAYGGSVLLQTPCAKFIEFDSGVPKYRVFVANRLTSGSTTLPDGRPFPYPAWDTDRAAFDSTTGYLYVYQTQTGDVLRIQTWASLVNHAYPSYSFSGQLHLPMEWCCKIPPLNLTNNRSHLICMHGAVWIVLQMAGDRARVFSWAPGDAHAWEHDTPFGMAGSALCRYTKDGDQRMLFIGATTLGGQRNKPPTENTYWTGVVT